MTIQCLGCGTELVNGYCPNNCPVQIKSRDMQCPSSEVRTMADFVVVDEYTREVIGKFSTLQEAESFIADLGESKPG